MLDDLVRNLRAAFQRKRYGDAPPEYDPDFDLFDVAADEIERLEERVRYLESFKE